jgi:hypothetical protein
VNVGEIAKEWYEEHEPPGELSRVILRCFFSGVIICRENFLLLAEPCFTARHGGGRNELLVLFRGFKGANGWYLHFWVCTKGMTSYELCLEAPYSLPWVAFKRRGKVKVYPWKLLYEKDFYLGGQPRNEAMFAVPC